MNEQPTQDVLPNRVPVCAIGCSAGGVTALQSLFEDLPDDLCLAYVVALHLAPDQPSVMHELLAVHTKMPVTQVRSTAELVPNSVYVLSPQQELAIEGDSVEALPVVGGARSHAPIDRLFRSLAAARPDGIAVLMTGAGSDGTRGVRAIKESGGIVIVQDPADAEYPMMPQSAIDTGAADFIESMQDLATRVCEVAVSRRRVQDLSDAKAADAVRQILAFLRTRTGHDFAGYKRATILRRIRRRVQLCRQAGIDEYAAFLRTDPDEPKRLFGDLLISVTSFFRDPDAFRTLQERCIRPIVESAEGEIRVWAAGCASGEEAYSLAILLLEEAARLRVEIPIQVFATDLDETALAMARNGSYPRSIEADVSTERLRGYFVDEGSHYRISRELRDIVLFATHSLIREPPFTRVDLLVCRNVLIYLERQLQQQVTSIFHYALKPSGFLFLGPAEMPDMTSGSFDAFERDARIYRARRQSQQAMPMLSRLLPTRTLARRDGHRSLFPRGEAGEILGSVHAGALETSAPPSALIDADHHVLNLSPNAGRFTLLPGGPINERLPAIVRPELRGELMIALDRVFNRKAPVLTRAVDVRFENEARLVAMHVASLPTKKGSRSRALVCFLDGGPSGQNGPDAARPDEQRDEIHRLHEDLRVAQEAALISRADHEGAVQDLRVANEELQSLNEEYRSTAEELETSKEELQSINEELHTVNFELKSKIDVVSNAHSDLLNLTTSSEIGTLFLDADLRIRMFTPPVREIYSISEADVGRHITDFTHKLAYHALDEDVRAVLSNLVPIEEEIRGLDGRWFLLRIRPYRTIEDKVSGVVATFNDITERKRDIAVKESEARYKAFVVASSDVVFRMSADWSEMFGLEGRGILADTVAPSRSWIQAYIDPEDWPLMQRSIETAIRTKGVFELEHRIRRADGSMGWTRSRAVPLLDSAGDIVEWLGTAIDVTHGRDMLVRAESREEGLRRMIDCVPVMLWEADPSGDEVSANDLWRAYTGQSTEDSQKLRWLAAIHPDDAEATRMAFLDAFATGRPLRRMLRIRRADGVYRTFLVRHVPFADAAGRIGRWYGSATDVTDEPTES